MFYNSPLLQLCSPCNSSDRPVIDERELMFTLLIDFDDAFNQENNNVFQIISNSIERQSRIHIPGRQTSDILAFRDGSTIVDFEITANMTIQDSDVDALIGGIFSDLKDTFPVRIVSPIDLKVEPPEIFFNDTVTLTCGPPPPNLEFTITSSVWTLDGDVIIEDERHRFERVDGLETLTITNYFSTDEGRYQCQLFDGQSIFVQDSNQIFSLLETPTIQVIPRQNTILCEVGQQVAVRCSVQNPYQVQFPQIPDSDTGSEIQSQVTITQEDCDNQELIVTCQEINFTRFERNVSLLLVRNGTFTCVNDPEFGDGFLNQVGRASCELNEVGEITAICRESGQWEDRENECILQRIAQLLIESQFLEENTLPEFLDDLSDTTIELSDPVTENPNNIEAIVTILNNVGNFVTEMDVEISQVSMEDVLLTTGVLTTDQAIDAWNSLNLEAVTEPVVPRNVTPPRNESFSSLLLFSLEDITRRLTNASFNITTPLILLNKTTFINNFNGDFNSTVEIDIEGSNGATNLTVITFESLNNVLPPRDENNATGRVINGRVVLVQSDTNVNNITFTFDIINDNLGNPQCVFWNFSLFDGLGGWDDEGCELVERVDQTVTCRCDHLTSFSMLMSPFFPNSRILSFITFIGVGISMASLVICLLIEGYMFTRRRVREDDIRLLRNISIMNIALSLLIANVWFIIGSSITEDEGSNRPACTAATFFIHFFYLALFFWMLNFAMLLLYNMFNLFGGVLSKRAQLIIGFSLGYGTPLLIASITIAVTAPNNTYVQETAVCWLNWNQSKALLAFVIPALIIVFINILILIVVIIKLIQSRRMQISVKDNAKNALGSIARTLAILTPFFGITWSLGVGTLVNPRNFGIHVAFAFFNSLQGFFVLVFGTLLDRTVRDEIAKPFSRLSQSSSGSGTRVTSSGASSSIFQVFKNIGRGGGNETSTSASSQAN
ncbi:adhesion G protein-coupled receptor F4-like [Syngnathus typhle]|uniref:adhesion G protein-coupled receptor F4-like n=1 Tax=Syngnathus typhle TaxID=161592 RepID=UPI002A698C6B|nr:adhesion G protein-coupled receptor F4-like [Syngnathus typhle]